MTGPRPLRRARVHGAAGLALAALAVAPARAASIGRAEIVLVGDPQRTHPLGAAIADLLGADALDLAWSYRPSVELEEILRPLAPGAGPAARVWVDVAQETRVHVYLADVGATRFAARSVPVETLDVATHETVAQIVRSSLRALLDQGAPALNREQMTAEVRKLVAADRGAAIAPTPVGLEARLGWLGSSPLTAGPVAHATWLTFGGVLGGGRLRLGLSAAAGYGFAWSVTQPSLPAGARLSTWGLRAGAALDFPLPGRLRGRAGLGGGFDRVHVIPFLTSGAEGGAVDATFGVARASAGAVLPVHGHLQAALFLHGELAPRLGLVLGDGSTLATSRSVRPGMEVALGWQL